MLDIQVKKNIFSKIFYYQSKNLIILNINLNFLKNMMISLFKKIWKFFKKRLLLEMHDLHNVFLSYNQLCLIKQPDHAYMRIVSHKTDLSADPFQPFLLLLLSQILVPFPYRFVESLAGIYRTRAYVSDHINCSERAASKLSLMNVDAMLSGSERLTRLGGRWVAVCWRLW